MTGATRLALLVGALGLTACQGVSKLDWGASGRERWQRPDDVVAALAVQPGDRVADLGAGEGYFLPYLTEAVGAAGQVYAVEVDEEMTSALEEQYGQNGANVTVVLGRTDDPELPDGTVDLVLLVNTFHHIEDRPAYFAKLRGDLSPRGRVAILEPNAELGGVLSLFLDEGHKSSVEGIGEDMRAAGYRNAGSHDFLPTQVFEVFAPEPDGG